MLDQEPFVPINKVAEHFSVSISTIRLWVRMGRIPKTSYIKIGNTYRFKLSEVSAALHNVEPLPPVDPAQLEFDFNESEVGQEQPPPKLPKPPKPPEKSEQQPFKLYEPES